MARSVLFSGACLASLLARIGSCGDSCGYVLWDGTPFVTDTCIGAGSISQEFACEGGDELWYALYNTSDCDGEPTISYDVSSLVDFDCDYERAGNASCEVGYSTYIGTNVSDYEGGVGYCDVEDVEELDEEDGVLMTSVAFAGGVCGYVNSTDDGEYAFTWECDDDGERAVQLVWEHLNCTGDSWVNETFEELCAYSDGTVSAIAVTCDGDGGGKDSDPSTTYFDSSEDSSDDDGHGDCGYVVYYGSPFPTDACIGAGATSYHFVCEDDDELWYEYFYNDTDCDGEPTWRQDISGSVEFDCAWAGPGNGSCEVGVHTYAQSNVSEYANRTGLCELDDVDLEAPSSSLWYAPGVCGYYNDTALGEYGYTYECNADGTAVQKLVWEHLNCTGDSRVNESDSDQCSYVYGTVYAIEVDCDGDDADSSDEYSSTESGSGEDTTTTGGGGSSGDGNMTTSEGGGGGTTSGAPAAPMRIAGCVLAALYAARLVSNGL